MVIFSTVTLPTARLVLRPLTQADASAMLAIFGDAEVMRYGSFAPWTGVDQADQYIADALAAYDDATMLRLVLEVAASGEVVGIATLHNFHHTNRRCEIGYMLNRQHWGLGYMGEALTALLSYGFSALELNRVEADIDPRNLASAKALQRAGFVKEGYLRERWLVNGEVCDTEFYGLLRSDWRAGIPADQAGRHAEAQR